MNLILFKFINIYSYDIYHFEKLNNSKILVLVISICCFLIYFEETLHQLPTCIYTRCKFFRFWGGLLFLFVLFCLFVWFVFNDTLRSFFSLTVCVRLKWYLTSVLADKIQIPPFLLILLTSIRSLTWMVCKLVWIRNMDLKFNLNQKHV